MDDFDIAQSKIGESAQRVVDRAVEETRRRDHAVLTNDHIFLAFSQVEWEAFTQVMRDLGPNPHEILQSIEEHLYILPTATDHELHVSSATKSVFKLAFHNASRAGRQTIESSDLFQALFEDSQGNAASIIRRYGIEPDVMVSRIAIIMREKELREEGFRKKFELPPFLKNFATNLNLLARQDKIPPVFGRDKETQQLLEILCHRERPNSAIIIGEPGVGKTAIVEGLARRIEFEPDTVPVRLRGCQIVNLQMNTMVAGTMLRGMFEDRIQNVIREIKERPNLILFIDEVHTMVGAGSALGAPSDAANVFKAVMARGEIRIIGATTLSEYKEYIQEDEALARRFRTVYVNEPSIEETREILYKLRRRLELNYSVRILDEAIETALEMSPRYQRHLRLPDKVIGWLDTAAVRAEISCRWEVRGEDVLDVISSVSQIPKDMVSRDTLDRLKDIELHLARRVVGQKNAVRAVADKLTLNKGPLKQNYNRSDGVLMFVGPTGVGKTELAKAVAEFLFGDDSKMIRVDMSEYQSGGVSGDKLIGMPRGIVGSERGGTLTNQLRDNPCSVVLLDEIEKASTEVLNTLLVAFDEGWITDGRGKRVYLSDSIVIMTSNIGAHHLRRLVNLTISDGMIDIDQVYRDLRGEIEKKFPPEFINRIDEIVIFSHLVLSEVEEIADNYLREISKRIASKNKVLEYDREVVSFLAKRGYGVEKGARHLKRTIDDAVKLPITKRWKEGKVFILKIENGELRINVQAAVLAV